MVLGASYSQIPLMRAAKRLGCHVIAASIPGPYAGFGEADEVVNVDITDPEAVLKAAQEHQIDGVATCCMDVGIRALGYVCEKMGLAGPDSFGAEAAADKSIEKAAYVEHGVNTAKHFLVHNHEELQKALDQLTFPVILKAVDQMGSRGIFRSNTRQEALDNFDQSMTWTKRDFCIVEEFIDGTMFGVEAMMSQGKLAYVLPLGNDQRDGNPPFPVGHYVPWDNAETLQSQIEQQVANVAKALHFDNCGMDLDCMYKDGKIYIIEATARAGATCITDTVSIYYGIDYFEAIVKAALGEDVADMFKTDKHTPSISRLLSSDVEGVVKSIQQPTSLPANVTDLSFNVAAGDEVRPMQNGRDRIGQLIVKGETLEECRKVQAEILNQIRVIV